MSNNLNKGRIELSIVMPCLNEVETIATCVQKATNFLHQNNVVGEVIVADNGSTDGSREIALAKGARVIMVTEKGYGSALKAGIKASNGVYIIMGDADDSYDFSTLMPFLDKLRNGYDLVMGNRFKGGIASGAMPFLHKYLGNPVLTAIGKVLFQVYHINDFHCGLRGFRNKSVQKLKLQSNGMEFASEMIVKAALMKMQLVEIPTKLYPDGRKRAPHLNTWSDGWRHLKLLIAYCPKIVMLTPLMIMAIAGFLLTLLFSPIEFSASYTNNGAWTLLLEGLILLALHTILFCYMTSTQALRAQLVPKLRGITRLLFSKDY